MCRMSEVFGAARCAQYTRLSLSPYCSDKRSGNAFSIGTSTGRTTDEPEGKVKSRMHVGYDFRTLCDVCFCFSVSTGVCERERGILVEVYGYVSRSMER